MTAEHMLIDMAEEVRKIEPPYVEPQFPVQPTDVVIVEEAPEDVKRIYTLQYRYGQQVALAQHKYSATGVLDDKDRHAMSMSDILLLVMWRRIALEFPPEDRELVGIRKGWKLVKPIPGSPALEPEFETTTVN